MEDFKLLPNKKLMVIGYNCYFLSLDERIRGPVDNIACISQRHVDALFDGTYLDIVSDKNNVEKLNDPEKADFATKIPKLDMYIFHNPYDEEFIKNQTIRYENFLDFKSKICDSDDYYFIVFVYNIYYAKMYKDVLKKYGVWDKTIAFSCRKECLNFFPNKVFIESDDKDSYFSHDIIQKIRNYFDENNYKTKDFPEL